jgi:hypothetical protein bthaB_32884
VTITDAIQFFDERYQEIESYLLFLQNVEKSVQDGSPQLSNVDAQITPEQHKILKASLYLQLYNLVESTVSRCLEMVVNEIYKAGRSPGDLSEHLRKEWVRFVARTHHDNLGPEKRFKAALEMCEQLLQESPITDFKIERGGGGNWDDSSIEEICERLGCSLTISPCVRTAVKRRRRNDMGALEIVKTLRNDLAHGSLSFAECGNDATVSELQDIARAVGEYLREAIECFINFIESNISKSKLQIKQGEVVA